MYIVDSPGRTVGTSSNTGSFISTFPPPVKPAAGNYSVF